MIFLGGGPGYRMDGTCNWGINMHCMITYVPSRVCSAVARVALF